MTEPITHKDAPERIRPVTLFFGACRLDRFVLSPEDSHHAVRVLRRKIGDRVWCIDGSGTACEVVLDTVDPRAAAGEIVARHRQFNEPAWRIELLCGTAQPARMDWVVEKATELGVHEIRPLQGTLLPGPGRVRRWSRIARGAAKQCCRGCVPSICPPAGLDLHLAELAPGGLRLYAEFGGRPLPDRSSLSRVVLAVGHDSGFTDAEVHSLEAAGFAAVDLGVRRLRTETAVVTLLAKLSGGV